MKVPNYRTIIQRLSLWSLIQKEPVTT